MILLELVFFGKHITTVTLYERNVALFTAFLGWFILVIVRNLSTHTSSYPADVLLGDGFTEFILGKSASWIISPFKKLIKLEGPIVDLLVSLAAAYLFYLTGPAIESLAALQSYMLACLLLGYSSTEIVSSLKQLIKEQWKLTKILKREYQRFLETKPVTQTKELETRRDN